MSQQNTNLDTSSMPVNSRESPFKAKQYTSHLEEADKLNANFLDAMADDEERQLEEIYFGLSQAEEAPKTEAAPSANPKSGAFTPEATDPTKPSGSSGSAPGLPGSPGATGATEATATTGGTSELREFIAAQTKLMADMMAQFQQVLAPKPVSEPVKPVPQLKDFRANPVAALQDAGVSIEQLRLHLEAQNTSDPAVKTQLQQLQLQQQIEQLQARLEEQQAQAAEAAKRASLEAAISQSYKGFTANPQISEKYPVLARVVGNDPQFAENAFRAHLESGRSVEETAQVLEGIWSGFLKAAAPAPVSQQPEVKPTQPPAESPKATSTHSTQTPQPVSSPANRPTNWYNRVQRGAAGDKPQLMTSQEILAELLRKG